MRKTLNPAWIEGLLRATDQPVFDILQMLSHCIRRSRWFTVGNGIDDMIVVSKAVMIARWTILTWARTPPCHCAAYRVQRFKQRQQNGIMGGLSDLMVKARIKRFIFPPRLCIAASDIQIGQHGDFSRGRIDGGEACQFRFKTDAGAHHLNRAAAAGKITDVKQAWRARTDECPLADMPPELPLAFQNRKTPPQFRSLDAKLVGQFTLGWQAPVFRQLCGRQIA